MPPPLRPPPPRHFPNIYHYLGAPCLRPTLELVGSSRWSGPGWNGSPKHIPHKRFYHFGCRRAVLKLCLGLLFHQPQTSPLHAEGPMFGVAVSTTPNISCKFTACGYMLRLCSRCWWWVNGQPQTSPLQREVPMFGVRGSATPNIAPNRFPPTSAHHADEAMFYRTNPSGNPKHSSKLVPTNIHPSR